MAENTNNGLDIEINAETALGKYTNLAVISHSPAEFIVDFAAILPGMQKPIVHSRIVLSPEHAKRLLMSLQDNVMKYEANVGKINISHPPIPPTFNKPGNA